MRSLGSSVFIQGFFQLCLVVLWRCERLTRADWNWNDVPPSGPCTQPALSKMDFLKPQVLEQKFDTLILKYDHIFKKEKNTPQNFPD